MNCMLCPHKCGIDRSIHVGKCGMHNTAIRIGRASLHRWEEPCISGENGSGTIFFSGCNLGCVYCQNSKLSSNFDGIDVDVDALAQIMLRLMREGAHNINLVTPTHYADQIIKAVRIARNNGLTLPIVYNTSGYESLETIKLLNGTVSVYLTDFKYFDDCLARRYSRIDDYHNVALAALKEMVLQVGLPQYDKDGMMNKGVIVRHLLLPTHVEDSKKILTELYDLFGDDIVFSIMNQYTPIKKLPFEELNNTVSAGEYNELIEHALNIGIQNAFIQEDGTQEESFIPNFNGEGVIF